MIVTCVDVGSTFTKAAAVDVRTGELVASGSHRTTVESDVLKGLDAAVAATGLKPDELLVCSSAGGGLRLAVLGYERLVTAHAGHRVGLSAGAKVVHIGAGRLDARGLAELRAARPDVVLLVGGTDGGDEETISHNALRLAKARFRVPVVLAGNADCRAPLTELLSQAGVPVTAAGNVLPAIGVLDPGPARAAIREVFLKHVIGGKKLSRGPRFTSLVKGATPDVVLSGVELLASRTSGDLLVVDIGGATTDVYSVLNPAEIHDNALGLTGAALAQVPTHEVAGTLWAARTVEGDLGMRWSALGVVEAAEAEKLIFGDDAAGLRAAAHEMTPDLPEHPLDPVIASLAATVALRRHARGEAIEAGGPRRGGRDLGSVSLVVGSGGVLRHHSRAVADRILGAAVSDPAGGWPLPKAPRLAVDSSYVLAAAGLLASPYPDAALALLVDRLVLPASAQC